MTMRRPGQLLLMAAHVCSVQDLHAFFVTLAATAQSADGFTDGCPVAPSGGRLQPLDPSALAKSQSTPDFRCFSEFGYGWLHRNGTRNGSSPHKQYIESVIENDFLNHCRETEACVGMRTVRLNEHVYYAMTYAVRRC